MIISCLTSAHSQVFTSSVGPESTVAVAALAVWPMIVEATKTLNKGSKDEQGEESVPTFPWL